MPDLGCGHARSWERDRRNGVSHALQVILYKVDPFVGESRSRSLLSNEDWRAALLDEPLPFRPEVPLVIKPKALACLGDRLARAAAAPDGSIVGPSGLPESEGPEPDAGEEVGLGESPEIVGADVFDRAGVDGAGGKVSGDDEPVEPSCCLRVEFVVVGIWQDRSPGCASIKHGGKGGMLQPAMFVAANGL